MALIPCTSCSTPTHLGQDCPHCGTHAAHQGDGNLKLSAALLGLGLSTGCFGIGGEADYGAPDSGYLDTGFVDSDGDGFGVSQDCDDDNDQIYPNAPETADDGVDSNCDGEDNT